MKRIAVIGGGISGLSAAYALEKKAAETGLDIEIDLLEKQGRTGGNITTERTGDFLIEGGPDCVYSEKPAALQMCGELGLGHDLLGTNDDKKGTVVYSNGRLHDLPEGVILMVPTMIKPMIFTSLISWPGKLRMALEPFLPKGPADVEETLGQFVRRRMGQELLDKIAEPLVAGIHAGDAETMSVKASFPRFVDMEQKYGSLVRGMMASKKLMASLLKKKPAGHTMFMTLKPGMQKLTDTMTAALTRTKIDTAGDVVSIEKKGDSYEVKTREGNSITADAVIIAAPSYEASKMVRGMDEGLGGLLQEIHYVSTATINLAYAKADLTQAPKGFGVLVPRVSKLNMRSSTITSNKFSFRASEDHVLLRVFIGGPRREHLVSLDDEEIITMVRGELKIVMGIDAPPLITRIHRWVKAWPQYEVGHLDRVKRIDEATAKHPGLYVTGCAYKGIGISDSIKNSALIVEQAIEFLAAASSLLRGED